MSEKSNDVSNKIKASIGSGIIAAVAKQPFENQDFGGYTKKIEKALEPIKINDKIKLNSHLAQLSRKIPMSILNAAGTYALYDLMKDKNNKKNNPSIKDKTLKYTAPAVGAMATLPIVFATQKFSPEIEALGLSKFKKNLLTVKNRALQTAIAAPLSVISYDAIKGNKDSVPAHIAAGVASGALGTASTAYLTAKYEALDKSTTEAAKILGKKIEKVSPFFTRPTKYGISRGEMLGRTVKVLKNKLPAGIVSFGAGIAGYNLIKKYLEKNKK